VFDACEVRGLAKAVPLPNFDPLFYSRMFVAGYRIRIFYGFYIVFSKNWSGFPFGVEVLYSPIGNRPAGKIINSAPAAGQRLPAVPEEPHGAV